MKVKWKKVVEFTIALLTLIGSFLGGQALAQKGKIDIFCKNPKIENHGRL